MMPIHSSPSSPPMQPSHVIGIAASAGGLNAVGTVLHTLSPDFPAAVIVVQHLAPRVSSHLSAILQKRTQLRVKEAAQADELVRGLVLVAPPDRHVLVTPYQTIRLSEDLPVNYLRPAADVLFLSLADQFKQRAIVVVLTGNGRDGAAGAVAVKAAGGFVVVQEPASAEYQSMPEETIKACETDAILPLADIGPYLMLALREES